MQTPFYAEIEALKSRGNAINLAYEEAEALTTKAQRAAADVEAMEQSLRDDLEAVEARAVAALIHAGGFTPIENTEADHTWTTWESADGRYYETALEACVEHAIQEAPDAIAA